MKAKKRDEIIKNTLMIYPCQFCISNSVCFKECNFLKSIRSCYRKMGKTAVALLAMNLQEATTKAEAERIFNQYNQY